MADSELYRSGVGGSAKPRGEGVHLQIVWPNFAKNRTRMKEFGGGGEVLGSGTAENVCFAEIAQTELFLKMNLNGQFVLEKCIHLNIEFCNFFVTGLSSHYGY